MSGPQSYVEGEAPASQQGKSNRGSKVTWALLVVCVLLAAALIVIYRLAFSNWRDNKKIQILKEENEALRKNITGMACLVCEKGWEKHGGRCYYFSTNTFTWNKSRDECRKQRGDLVKIDSREEQTFLEGRLREQNGDKFWIGLTDSQTEGTFLWTDGSELDMSLRFWSLNEPDNWTGYGPGGEDCVMMGKKEGADDLKCWFDKSCKVLHKSICEKPSIPGLVSCVHR